jgi:hypothetical protein
MYVSPSVSPKIRSFFFPHTKIKGVGREVAKSQVLRKIKSLILSPQPLYLIPTNILRILQDCQSGDPLPTEIQAGLGRQVGSDGWGRGEAWARGSSLLTCKLVVSQRKKKTTQF